MLRPVVKKRHVSIQVDPFRYRLTHIDTGRPISIQDAYTDEPVVICGPISIQADPYRYRLTHIDTGWPISIQADPYRYRLTAINTGKCTWLIVYLFYKSLRIVFINQDTFISLSHLLLSILARFVAFVASAVTEVTFLFTLASPIYLLGLTITSEHSLSTHRRVVCCCLTHWYSLQCIPSLIQ